MDGNALTPAWVQCPDCDDYWCTIHQAHAYDCDCPPIEEWIERCDITPYEPGNVEKYRLIK